jgi:hypothetical protein
VAPPCFSLLYPDLEFPVCVSEDSGSGEKYRGSSIPSNPRGGIYQIHLEDRTNANSFWVALPVSLLRIAC